MVFEHFAFNTEKPVEMAQWYVNNLEMKIVRAMDKEPFTTFLADKTGRVVMEIYCNRTAKVPEHKLAHPLEFHFAFMVKDSAVVKDKLMNAGCTFEEEIHLPDGSLLFMLRDPFGVPLQICQRANPMMNIEL